MGSKVNTAIELVEMIKKENISGNERIPNSETHMKIWCAHFAFEEKAIRKILEDLKEAHYIFIINIVNPDTHLYLPGTDSYVIADFAILNDLKRFSELRLEKTYESTFYKKKSPFQIIRELFPKIREYNNTPIGKSVNESVMIDEFIRVLTNSAFEYTDQWKINKLREIYSESEEAVSNIDEELGVSLRAADQVVAKEVVDNSKTAWGKATNSFPVEFLLRIHFRKYEFEVVKKLIQTGKIHEASDLKYIRDTLQVMETRTQQDPILKRYMNEMVDLRRLAQTRLNTIRKSQEKS
jgi:hypothetical protein